MSGGEIVYQDGAYYVEKPKEGGVATISRNRKKYGLWPIETQMKMIKQYKSGINTEFRISTGVSYGYPPEIIEKYFIKIGEDDTHTK